MRAAETEALSRQVETLADEIRALHDTVGALIDDVSEMRKAFERDRRWRHQARFENLRHNQRLNRA